VGGTTSLSSLSDCIEAVGIGCDDERSREPENMACKVLATSKLRVHGNAYSLKLDTRTIEFGDLARKQQQAKQQQATFGAHFVEVAVDAATAEVRVRRMLAVCASGRILNPKAARSQVIGAMTMGVGAALMEELVVDKRVGFFVNHDLASYEVPVHADIPHQEVVFLEETDPMSSPMKAKGVAELGICGVAAAVANAVYNATGVRVRDYPITLDKLLDRLPSVS
jgi:xanthine dehydrogenase YagR molybdenum-binding subunit